VLLPNRPHSPIAGDMFTIDQVVAKHYPTLQQRTIVALIFQTALAGQQGKYGHSERYFGIPLPSVTIFNLGEIPAPQPLKI
jgi:hypothetical protein